MKRILYILITLCLFTACQKAEEPAVFKQAESLLYTAPDSARKLLTSLPEAKTLSGSSKANPILTICR